MKSFLLFPTLFLYLTISIAQATTHEENTTPIQAYNYTEQVGDSQKPFTWELRKNSDHRIIQVFEPEKSFYNLCLEDGTTLEWRMKEEGIHDLQVVRDHNSLKLSGTRFGKSFEKNVNIDDRPWFQPLSFSLGDFLDSDKEKITFWVVRVDTIDVLSLQAKKVGEEVIIIDGVSVPTKKIEIRAEGYYSSFWHGDYWYRKSDNLFVKYSSVHGMPGTPRTIVELVDTIK